MAKFQYTAMDASGKEVKDRIDAENEQEAGNLLRQKGLYPINVTPVKGARTAGTKPGGKPGAGAVGAGLSGSGPTIYALSDDRETAVEIAEAMVDAFSEVGATATAIISGVDPHGAQVSLLDV